MDNATCHYGFGLSYITIKYMPPNISHTQPLDQGIIKVFKSYYGPQVLQCVIGYLDNLINMEIAKMVALKDACIWAAKLWNAVKAETISKCFQQAGFHNQAIDADGNCHLLDSEELTTTLSLTIWPHQNHLMRVTLSLT